MAKITEIYKEYKTDNSLQLHQFRVAAVAAQICDSLTVPVDKETVVTACLIHDMGNIIKYDFEHPDLLEPEGVEYWKKIQKEFADRYGTSEHQASVKIARELGVSDQVVACIESISFKKTVHNAQSDNLEIKIVDYSDLRVTPGGIGSLEDRLEEGRKRYKKRVSYWISDDDREQIYQACYDMQGQVFENSKIKPTDITNDSVAPFIEQLKSYEI